jgi:hypothetical protein
LYIRTQAGQSWGQVGINLKFETAGAAEPLFVNKKMLDEQRPQQRYKSVESPRPRSSNESKLRHGDESSIMARTLLSNKSET